ncbi:MAG: hypothetical protein WBE11_15090 [Candidatus Aminicenantaceae bacterium]
MEKIKELYVVIENRPKATGEMLRILKKKNISMYAVGVFQDNARLYVSGPNRLIRYSTIIIILWKKGRFFGYCFPIIRAL